MKIKRFQSFLIGISLLGAIVCTINGSAFGVLINCVSIALNTWCGLEEGIGGA